jgi:hypothetical protein
MDEAANLRRPLAMGTVCGFSLNLRRRWPYRATWQPNSVCWRQYYSTDPHHGCRYANGQIQAHRHRTLTCSMLANGKYSAWFRTPDGGGTAIVTLSDGTITGGDSFFEYSGSYEQNGDRLTATVRIRRLCDGPAVCAGTAEQAPGVGVEVTLIPCREDPSPKPELVHRPAPFDATKLPKAPSR